MGLAATKLSPGEPTGSKDKEIISLKEEIKNLQMTLELETLKVNAENTKDQVINDQEKLIKRLEGSLDQEKEEKKRCSSKKQRTK